MVITAEFGAVQNLPVRNEIYSRWKLTPRQQRLIFRQGGRTMIPRQLDDAALSQPLDVIVGMAIRTKRTKGGSVPERLIVPCNYRRDRDARQSKQGGQKGNVDNPIVVPGL
jgi:hypothetical protein